jgi:hypothetical protein
MVDISMGGGLRGPPPNLPPYSDTNNPKIISVLTTFLGLAIIAYVLRIWSRIRIYRVVGLDDYAITIALVNSNPLLAKSYH